MSRVFIIARWALAVLVAVLGYLAGIIIVTLVWKAFGGGIAKQAYLLAVALATLIGSLAGGYVLPPQNWRAACILFVTASVLFSVVLLLQSLIAQTFKPTNLLDVGGSLIGGFIVLQLSSALRGRQRKMHDQPAKKQF